MHSPAALQQTLSQESGLELQDVHPGALTTREQPTPALGPWLWAQGPLLVGAASTEVLDASGTWTLCALGGCRERCGPG